ncbi:MAG TPA: pentapeptide repeat-containing protein [Candidatus Bathyarchaeia archaeon]|nr:pentapeptide repeat-containing protein [Candidatus Bathyarchaeia archaeon]
MLDVYDDLGIGFRSLCYGIGNSLLPDDIGDDLSEASFSGADLYQANLYGAILSGANLRGAYSRCSVLIGIEPQNYESMALNTESNFEGAFCHNVDFIYYISLSTLPENIPNIVNDKKELKSKLMRMGFEKQKLESILEVSKLSD